MIFIKKYWFELLILLWLMAFVIMLVLIVISPKHDLKNRGFTYCTQNLVGDLQDCEGAVFCSTKAVALSTWCDVKIIADGIKLWYKGEQPTPWSNYIFTPETVKLFDDTDDEDLADYLKENPDTVSHLQELIKLRKDLDNDTKENNIDLKKIIPESTAPGMGLE